MGSTSRHALPYPEGGGLVTQGDDAIQALAEAVDATLEYDTRAEISPAESAAFTVGGTSDVDLNGTKVLHNFVYADRNLTYTGPTARYCIVAASVEVIMGGPVAGAESTLSLRQNGVEVSASHDNLQFGSSIINQRLVTHTITTPTLMTPGDVIDLHVFASPDAQVGVSSLDIYPIGPA